MAALTVVAMSALAPTAVAQTVVDATTAEFEPSTDHSAVAPDGTPLVTTYVIDILPAGSPAPAYTIDLGKPAPDGDGVIRVPFASLLPAPLVGGMVYQARVWAVGPGGSAVSQLSNTFASSAPCTPGLSARAVSLAAAATSGTITVTAGTTCEWTAAADAGWLSITSDTPVTGTSTVVFAAAANTETTARTGTLTIAGQTVTVTQGGVSAVPCAPELSASSASVPAAASNGTVTVTAGATCEWGATANNSWLSITSATPVTGDGTVAFAAAVNTSTTQRSGTLTIAGQTVTITQAGAATPCAPVLSVTSVSAPVTLSTGSITVTTGTSCVWTATANNSWLSITSATPVTGSNTVTYRAAANSSTSPRSGTLTIAGRTVTFSQPAGGSPPACTYAINPTNRAAPAGGETVAVAVTAPSGCPWTATPNNSFLSVASGSNGSGNGTANIRVSPNSSTSQRNGTVTIAGRSFAVTQAGACSVTVSPGTVTAPAAGTSGTLAVSTSATCSWSATGVPSWITVPSGTRTGSGNLTFTVAPNGGAARTVTFTIAGRPITIDQGAAALPPPANFRIIR